MAYCGYDEVLNQLNYIEATWVRTKEHIELGHSEEQAVSDPGYPRYSELGYERLHPWNIKVIYKQLFKQLAKTG